MSKEIERKFLVNGEFRDKSTDRYNIQQAYFCTKPERTVRIRKFENQAFLTIKGISSSNGLTRQEHETEIDADKAGEMLEMAKGFVIKKSRYIVPVEQNLKWEVDVFEDENAGLVIAEIELESETQVIEIPAWIGEEVTGIEEFYNSSLSETPISRQSQDFKKRFGIMA